MKMKVRHILLRGIAAAAAAVLAVSLSTRFRDGALRAADEDIPAEISAVEETVEVVVQEVSIEEIPEETETVPEEETEAAEETTEPEESQEAEEPEEETEQEADPEETEVYYEEASDGMNVSISVTVMDGGELAYGKTVRLTAVVVGATSSGLDYAWFYSDGGDWLPAGSNSPFYEMVLNDVNGSYSWRVNVVQR